MTAFTSYCSPDEHLFINQAAPSLPAAAKISLAQGACLPLLQPAPYLLLSPGPREGVGRGSGVLLRLRHPLMRRRSGTLPASFCQWRRQLVGWHCPLLRTHHQGKSYTRCN
ncbi:unnamed protein product [Heterosigma akashiwo]